HAALFDVVGYSVKCHLESRAITSPATLPFDRAAMKIDKMFRNRQAQAESAKLTAERGISLLEWPEERSLPFDFNSDAVISDLKLKTTIIVVGAPDLDLAARDPSKVEQVVNQPCLLLDVAFDYVHVLHEFRLKLSGVISKISRRRQRWCQRRAQFMAQRCKEIVLRFTCPFRCDLFRCNFARANLLSDVARDFG